jgi:hypothetical protein
MLHLFITQVTIAQKKDSPLFKKLNRFIHIIGYIINLGKSYEIRYYWWGGFYWFTHY